MHSPSAHAHSERFRSAATVSIVTLLAILLLASAPGALGEQAERPRAEPDASEPSQADLSPAAIRWSPEDPMHGESVTFEVDIENDGLVPVLGYDVAFSIDGQVVDTEHVFFHAPQATVTVESDVWLAEGGEHTLHVQVDADETVDEANGTNNDAERSVYVRQGDYELTWLATDATSPRWGEEVVLASKITNVGDAPLDDTRLTFRIDGTSLETAAFEGLAPGEETTVEANWKTDGRHHLVAETGGNGDKTFLLSTDGLDRYPEPGDTFSCWIRTTEDPDNSSDDATQGNMCMFGVENETQGSGYGVGFVETRDEARIQFFAEPEHPTPLDAQSFDVPAETWFKAEITWGTNGTIDARLYNTDGEQIASLSAHNDTYSGTGVGFIVNARWGGDNTALFDDYRIVGEGPVDEFRKDLSPYNELRIDASNGDFRLPEEPSASGDVPIDATVDPDGWNQEADEGNNAETIEIHVRHRNLEITALETDPASPVHGDEVTVELTVTNTGELPANATDVAASIGSSFHATLDVPALDAGEKAHFSAGPWTAEGGDWTLAATVDPADGILEDNETDNEEARDLRVRIPDLHVANIQRMDEPGNRVRFEADIANTGDAAAGPFSVPFLLDAESIGTERVDRLPAGATVTATSDSWTIEPGDHHVTSIADVHDEVPESEEDDNERTETFTFE